ncbi:MAG: ABC transporter ATP-binding protein, partial [Actinomycetota bacterium]
LVPEGRRLFTDMSVLDNLRMGAFHPAVRRGMAEALEHVLELFPVLRDRSAQIAGTLSGGEQQMVALGRAMMSRPRLLLLDEPSLGLAPIVVDQVFDMVERIRDEGVTVLLAEQNSHRALGVSSRGYVLADGHVVKEGPVAELLETDEVRQAYLGQ